MDRCALGGGMAEQEEKGPLEKPIDWFSGWKASFERTRQRFGMPVAVLLTLSVAGGLVWWNWDDIAKRPGVESILARFNQRALPTAPAGRLAIAVMRSNSTASSPERTNRWPKASRFIARFWTNGLVRASRSNGP
jgi:hypothetical protein